MKQTKKDRIIKRLIEGHDPDVIAEEENTTKSYVYKIGSANRIKIDQESKEIKIIDQNNADLSPEYMSTKKGLEWTSSLGREERKKLYVDFHNDLSNEEIIRKYGWDPIIVERERVGCENASRFKPHELQNDLLNALGLTCNRGGKLYSNREIIDLIFSHINYKINQIITNFSANPPPGYSGIICAKCKSYIPGVIYNSSLVPSYMRYLFNTTLCQVCHQFTPILPRL